MSIQQALIFAAGLGERMRPLTDRTPKPLLAVGGKPLIVWHLEQMQAIGIRRVVINISWLAEQFPLALGDGSHWGLEIRYSNEPYPPLETGGGMLNAWTHLDRNEPLLAVNGDVWSDFAFATLPGLAAQDLAHLVMVNNPEHNAGGDFALSDHGRLQSEGSDRRTFAGVGIYRYALFADWPQHVAHDRAQDPARFKLAPLLRHAMHNDRVSGQLHTGAWTDVGTPERLRQLDAVLNAGP